MAYQTGTATSQEDLMSALNTFAVAQGWTSNIMSTTNDWMAINNGSVFVQFRWDNTAAIAPFHSRAFVNTSTAPGNHTDDDGCGTIDASTPYNALITTGRRISISNGPYTAYHFFTDGTTKYIHVVVEMSPGIYRHFSFGTITKYGTWTGGEYCTAHLQVNGTPSSGVNKVLWSGVSGGGSSIQNSECGSLHVEGMANQTVGQGKWLLFSVQTSLTFLGNDRQSTPRQRIGAPGSVCGANPWLAGFGYPRASLLNGFLPLIPLPIWWRDGLLSPSPYMLLGFAPDVWHIQMANLSPAQTFTIAADTYMVFPLVRKQFTGAVDESRNCGIVYKKIP